MKIQLDPNLEYQKYVMVTRKANNSARVIFENRELRNSEVVTSVIRLLRQVCIDDIRSL